MSAHAVDPNVLQATIGYLAVDARGRIVGRVERASADGHGRLTVRGSLPFRRRRVVLATEIEDIDETSGVVALRVERSDLRAA